MLNEILIQLQPAEWLKLNAGLQKKKNAVRAELKNRGVLKREGVNSYDKYKYFSEGQYKLLFTELLAAHGLELKFNELEYGSYEGSEKQSNGRTVRVEYTLIDSDTGFGETTTITGEGMDKGDKAGYKAYTGTLKYYLANTFLVATGDDPETESPEATMNTRKANNAPQSATGGVRKATAKQVEMLAKWYTGDKLEKLLEVNGIEKLEDISIKKASELIDKITKKNKEGEQNNG